MATLKTVPTKINVLSFIDKVEDPVKRKDCLELLQIMEEVTGETAKMWGPAIIGIGQYHYKYESGREGDFLMTGFSPRKQNISVYIMVGFERYPELMAELGKYKIGKSCLYLKKLADINQDALKKLITYSMDFIREKYG